MYEVEITPEGHRHLDRPPPKVRGAVVETILGSIAENPRRAGKPLRGELEGLCSARRGEFRAIYEFDETRSPGRWWRSRADEPRPRRRGPRGLP